MMIENLMLNILLVEDDEVDVMTVQRAFNNTPDRFIAIGDEG
jgi:hypothetical protein